jgi:aspartate carbamoyltransferase catalytic subunit
VTITHDIATSGMALGHTWSRFTAAYPDPRAKLLAVPGIHSRAILSAEQFDRGAVDRIFSLADLLLARKDDARFGRQLRQVLAHRSCALYFPQCSTRTFVSFSLAAQALGLMIEEIRDPELSAEYKGESELDTLLVLAQLADLVVIREKGRDLLDRFAFEMLNRSAPTKIINAGTGADQHPTQALLDLYTLQTRMNLRSGQPKRVAFVGDLRRSRTARSLAHILAIYPHVEQVYVAPEQLQMQDDLINAIEALGVTTRQSPSLDGVLADVDAVYMMRMQDEYSETSDDLRREYREFYLTPQRINRLRRDAVVIHPLPRRDEIPLEFDYDSRAAYWPAVGLGKIVREALILTMFGMGEKDLT